jgi:hypothetical protein
MASRLAVVSVRPVGPPCGHGTRHFPPVGRPGVVRCLGPSVRAHLPRGLRLYGGPWWTAVRGAGPGRLRLAPAAAWPLIGPHPGEPLAPARVLGPANATAVRHGHGLRNVLLGPHRPRLHHTVGLQQHGGSVLMAILTHATWNTFYSAASWRSSPSRRRRQLPEPHHSRVGAGYHRRDARAAGLPGSGLSPS